jgi:hypothetical protein
MSADGGYVEAVICPKCKTPTRVTKTVAGMTTYRLLECGTCGKKGRSEERITEWDGLPVATNSRRREGGLATNSHETLATKQSNLELSRGVSTQNGTGASGGVGGGLSSDSDSGSDPDLHTPQTRAWTSEDWYRKFGQAWALKKGRLAYGRGSMADARATGSLSDILGSLGAEAARAQAIAPAMFEAFLGLDDEKLIKEQHPWSWFVSRFNGILTSVLASINEVAERRAVKKADSGLEWWNDPNRMKGPPADFVAERERRRALAVTSAAPEGSTGQRTKIVEPSAN